MSDSETVRPLPIEPIVLGIFRGTSDRLRAFSRDQNCQYSRVGATNVPAIVMSDSDPGRMLLLQPLKTRA